MGKLTISNETTSSVTVISNIFIDKYMKDANDAQLKVYLYVFRMLQSNKPFGLSDIADQFNHTEREVLRALKYWEKHHLMALSFDSSKNLVGIRLLEPGAPDHGAQVVSASAAPTQPAPASDLSAPEILSPAAPSPAPITMAPAEAIPEMDKFAKPSYSADQLRIFKEQEGTAQLLFIAQAYVGKPLSVSDMKTILYMSDVLGFSEDLIDHLIQYCVEKGKKDFRYMEKVALNWAEAGVRTPEEADAISLKHDRSVYAIMNELGKSSAPTTKELEYINRWTKEYGFTNDVIFEACARTVLATDKHRFEYADGILSNWKKENVRHKADIQKLDDSFAQKRTQTSRPVTNKFNQFKQNSYDFDELEKALLGQ